MHIYIDKYNQLSLYNVTSMYVFRTDYLVLDNPVVRYSLRRTLSDTFHIL